jgi:two-component system invasion response regulator UvrY
VDDHELVRSGFRSLIESVNQYKVVVESASAEEAWRDYLTYHPDVVIMDISMPGMGGIEGIKRILSRDSNAKVIVLTMHGNEMAQHVIRQGASGYISKSGPPEMIIKAIQAVLRGEVFVSGCSITPKKGESIQAKESPFASLSKREFEVVMLLLKEKTNNDIADLLGLSAKTVHVHKSRIFQKLNVSSLVGLTRLALSHDLMELDGADFKDM